VAGFNPTEGAFDKMLAARCTQNAQGRRFQRPRFGAQFAQALIELAVLRTQHGIAEQGAGPDSWFASMTCIGE
jgi:hypothetical protein